MNFFVHHQIGVAGQQKGPGFHRSACSWALEVVLEARSNRSQPWSEHFHVILSSKSLKVSCTAHQGCFRQVNGYLGRSKE